MELDIHQLSRFNTMIADSDNADRGMHSMWYWLNDDARLGVEVHWVQVMNEWSRLGQWDKVSV